MNYSGQSSAFNENLPIRYASYEYRTQSLPRHSSTRDSSTFGPSAPTLSSSASSESDIFTISQARPDCNKPRQVKRHVNLRCRPTSYIRHSNLDVRPLSWNERMILARIHYVTIPNIVRLAMVVFCLSWFIYVANSTLNEYKLHETMVHMSFNNPNTSLPPSITVCSHDLLETFPDSSIPKISALKLLNRDDTENILKSSRNLPTLSFPNIEITCWLIPTAMGKDSEKQLKNCTDLVPVVVHISEGRRCFTYFSDIYGQTTRALKKHPELQLHFDQFPSIQLQVTGEYIYGIATSSGNAKKIFSGVYISLHDNDILPHMVNSAFHLMIPGKMIFIPFIKRVEKLLPPPYITNCYPYEPTKQYAKVVNERKYRSRGECFLECQWATMNTNCASVYSIYTRTMVERQENLQNVNEVKKMLETPGSLLNMTIDGDTSEFFKICPKTNHSFSDYIYWKEYCRKACPDACDIDTFIEDKLYTSKVDLQNSTYAVVQWSSNQVTKIVHRPKWDLPDFLGTLGGDLHIWVGVSVLNLISYTIKMIRSGELFPDTSIASIINWFVNAYD